MNNKASKPMLSFTQERKDDLIAKIEAHAKADAFRQGYCYNKKGCAVGRALVHHGVPADDYAAYEDLFGIPIRLARLEGKLFERLSFHDSKEWPLRFTRAVPTETDLSKVWVNFTIRTLADKEKGAISFATSKSVKKAINLTIELLKRWDNVTIREAWMDARFTTDDAIRADVFPNFSGSLTPMLNPHSQKWMADVLVEELIAAGNN
jgi:hypothetical protein